MTPAFDFVQTVAAVSGSLLLLGSDLASDWVLINGRSVPYVNIEGVGDSYHSGHGIIIRVPEDQRVGVSTLLVGQSSGVFMGYVSVRHHVEGGRGRAYENCLAGHNYRLESIGDPRTRQDYGANLIWGPHGNRFDLGIIRHSEWQAIVGLGVNEQGATSGPWLFDESCACAVRLRSRDYPLWSPEGISLWQQGPVNPERPPRPSQPPSDPTGHFVRTRLTAPDPDQCPQG